MDLSLLFNVMMDSIKSKNPNLTKINYRSLATFELVRDNHKNLSIGMFR